MTEKYVHVAVSHAFIGIFPFVPVSHKSTLALIAARISLLLFAAPNCSLRNPQLARRAGSQLTYHCLWRLLCGFCNYFYSLDSH